MTFPSLFSRYLTLIWLSILVVSCSGTGGGSTPTGSVELNWQAPLENTDGTALSDLTGYKIYYGSSADGLNSSIMIDNPGLTTYVIEHLYTNTDYYFAVTAINSQQIESNFSNIVIKYVTG